MGVHNLAHKSEFDQNVTQDDSGVVVIDFFATWCGPCKVIAPKVLEMSNTEKFSGAKFYKIDVDEVPEVAQEWGIRAMPTFLVFKDGKKVDEIVGVNQKALIASVEKALESARTGIPYEPVPKQTNFMSYLPLLIVAVMIYRWYMGI